METPQPSNNELSKNDIVNLLSEEEVEAPKEDLLKSEPEPESKKEEKEPEKKEEELELTEEKEEPEENDLELVTPVKRQEILKKYPTIFKDFPYLEKAYYREQKYTEILPTIEDAQEAVEARDNFKKFESELLNGNTETILKEIKDVDEKAFAKIVDNYLPTLAKVDRNAYFHILGNVSKNIIASMAREAQQTKNEDLQNAALLVHQYIFGTSDFTPASNFSKQEQANPEAEKLKKEKEEFISQRATMVMDDLQSRTDNVIKGTIANHMDPKGVMTDYVKRTAIKEAQDALVNAIESDNRFQQLKDKLWEKAFSSNFSKQSIDAIKSAYLSKAKTLLPEIIKKSRNDALRGLGKRVVEDKEDETPLPVGHTAAPRKSSQLSGKGNENAAKGKRTIDFFNED